MAIRAGTQRWFYCGCVGQVTAKSFQSARVFGELHDSFVSSFLRINCSQYCCTARAGAAYFMHIGAEPSSFVPSDDLEAQARGTCLGSSPRRAPIKTWVPGCPRRDVSQLTCLPNPLNLATMVLFSKLLTAASIVALTAAQTFQRLGACPSKKKLPHQPRNC